MGVACVVGLLLPSGAGAHGLGAECVTSEDGKSLRVTAYFTDGTAAGQAKLRLENLDGRTLAEGVADDAGRWSIACPEPDVYVLIVDAGGGHRKRIPVTVRASGSAADGPTLADAQRFPWLRLAGGLACLGGIAWASRSALRRVNRAS